MARRELVQRVHRSVSRLARSFQQLMREQLSCGPVTVQQCYTLAALVEGGPKTMKSLAADVGLHQSTLTRVVEKLERQAFLRRERGGDDQRSVRVALTDAGRRAHARLDADTERMVGVLLDGVSSAEQAAVVKGLEVLSRVVDPRSAAFRDLLCRCGSGGKK